jgi:hypothetical protein
MGRQAPRFVKLTLLVVATGVAAFGAAIWWALESGGVAVIETRAPNGAVRSTHVWYVEPNRELWLEAGTPENPWFLDVQRHPTLTFRADARSARYLTRPVADPSGHTRIRSLMRQKYGLRDRWVGLLFDTSRSVAVQLMPADEKPGGTRRQELKLRPSSSMAR